MDNYEIRQLLILARVIVLVSLCTACTDGVDLQAQQFRSPYYVQRQWRVWRVDGLQQAEKLPELAFAPESQRYFPHQDDLFKFDAEGDAQRFAGWWDDVVVSQDNFHSSIAPKWEDGQGHQIKLSGQFPVLKRGYYEFQVRDNQVISPATAELKQLGANFTCQSTTYMGHHIANHGIQVVVLEREFYFADILRSGPAHTSFRVLSAGPTIDEYLALLPSMYNSIGSSRSESWALAKMVIAGANLRPAVKQAAKEYGLYPATLLYLWKAALPYDVPYAHELRHKVAYLSDGEDRQNHGKRQVKTELPVHQYNDRLHLENMVRLARQLRLVPPVAVLGDFKVESGRSRYGLRTAALAVASAEDCVVTFSTIDSFDVAGLPVTVRVEQLCGNPAAKVEQISRHAFRITVPYDPNLPRGRTSFAVIANNGVTDGNPAIVTIYNQQGKPNQRPRVKVADHYVVSPGQTLDIELHGEDPEGYPVHFYKRSDQPGKVDGNRYVWQCPPDQPVGDQVVTLIASDRTSGSSWHAVPLNIRVRSVRAAMKGQPDHGPAPLKVDFRAVVEAGKLNAEDAEYRWDFGDGETAIGLRADHVYQTPGLYPAVLEVTRRGAATDAAGDGSVEEPIADTDQARQWIRVLHDWPLVVDNGWDFFEVLPGTWRATSPGVQARVQRSVARRSSKMLVQFAGGTAECPALELVRSFAAPCFVDVSYTWDTKAENVAFDILGASFGVWDGTEQPMLGCRLAGRGNEEPTVVPIAPLPGESGTEARLQVYVTPDPAQTRRYRYSGVWSVGGEAYPFIIDDREVEPGRIAIVGNKPGAITVSRFAVYAP